MADARAFCEVLKGLGFDFYTGVPCSHLRAAIAVVSGDEEYEYVPATREDEAMGMAAGAALGGRTPAVFMQNSGLGNSIDAITSLHQLYKLPVLMVISWRGEGGKDYPEHVIMGQVMMSLLEAMEIPTFVLSEGDSSDIVRTAAERMRKDEMPVALAVRMGVLR